MKLSPSTLEDMYVAFLSRKGSYLENDQIWRSLIVWATNNVQGRKKYFSVTYVEPDKSSNEKTNEVCVCIPKEMSHESTYVQYKKINGGFFLTTKFLGTYYELVDVYKRVFTELDHNAIYRLDHREIITFVNNDPNMDNGKRYNLELFIPVIEIEDSKIRVLTIAST